MPGMGRKGTKMQKKNYQEEILNLIHSGLPQAELAEKLSDYHENDLADALTALTPDERQKLYPVPRRCRAVSERAALGKGGESRLQHGFGRCGGRAG